jgi:hypothetical protein
MAATYVEIDIGGDDAELFCPACGSELIGVDGEFGSPDCKHFLFGFVDAAGVWDSVSEAFSPILEKLSKESSEYGYPVPWDEEFLAGCPDGTLVFALNSSGMACGPVRISVCVGVHFSGLGEGDVSPAERSAES